MISPNTAAYKLTIRAQPLTQSSLIITLYHSTPSYLLSGLTTHLILFDFNVKQPKVHSQTIRPKKWARNTDQIPHTELEALVSSQILPPLELTSTDDLTSHYNTKMAEVPDTVAPLKLKKSRCIPSRSWFNKGLNKER